MLPRNDEAELSGKGGARWRAGLLLYALLSSALLTVTLRVDCHRRFDRCHVLRRLWHWLRVRRFRAKPIAVGSSHGVALLRAPLHRGSCACCVVFPRAWPSHCAPRLFLRLPVSCGALLTPVHSGGQNAPAVIDFVVRLASFLSDEPVNSPLFSRRPCSRPPRRRGMCPSRARPCRRGRA